MPSALKELVDGMITSLGVEGLEIPLTAVKFFKDGEAIPESVSAYQLTDLTLTACQACRQAALGDPVCLTRGNIGCVAAAISLGLVSAHEPNPLGGARVYTEIMRRQSGPDQSFVPPSPKDFTEGIVYACREAGRSDFSLFGPEDSGRYQDVNTARKAVQAMVALTPATTEAVFLYPVDFEDESLIPDVLVLSVRPVELTRIIQAHQYLTGQPTDATMGALRVVCSDLIARPFVSQQINIATYCLGARLIAKYEADRLGLGIPFEVFKDIVVGMKRSRTGYPFHLYPGA
jgi:uncharacterized protein (DUF169 family)